MDFTPFTKGSETDREVFIIDKTGREVISCFGSTAFINRDNIIKACNSHDELIAALDGMLAVFSQDASPDGIDDPKYLAIMHAAIVMDKIGFYKKDTK